MQLDYYQHVLELIGWRLVQIIGHLDLIKIHLTPEESKVTSPLKAKVLEVLDAAKEAGVALDVNSAGLRKPAGEIYPTAWILKEAARRVIPVTLGDDSHSPDQVGWGLDKAIDAIAKAGYESISIVDEDGNLKDMPIRLNRK